MKKNIIALLIATLVFSVAGCGKEEITTTKNESVTVSEAVSDTTQAEETEQQTEENAEAETGDLSELNALGDIEVEENLFSVEITIPKDYVGETTQEELTKSAEEKGFKSITLNEDGSATYVMTKKQHREMLDEMSASIYGSLDEMVNSGDYSFTEIKANDNFTDFTVITSATELGLQDSFSVIGFYMYGGMYSIFSGEEIDNIHVSFVNADTGEVISESNSRDMQ